MIRFLTITKDEIIIHLDDIYIVNSGEFHYVCHVYTELNWVITADTYMEMKEHFRFISMSPIVEFSLGE